MQFVETTTIYTPTFEEVAHEFAHSKYFTKLDARRHGYWSIVLAEESSPLTSFNNPFGQYLFRQLPFGLVCLQDMFQNHMDQILEKCEGCIRIADDITGRVRVRVRVRQKLNMMQDLM